MSSNDRDKKVAVLKQHSSCGLRTINRSKCDVRLVVTWATYHRLQPMCINHFFLLLFCGWLGRCSGIVQGGHWWVSQGWRAKFQCAFAVHLITRRRATAGKEGKEGKGH
jgi:hypothetical protein